MGKDFRRSNEWLKAERAYHSIITATYFSAITTRSVLISWAEIDHDLEEILEQCPFFFPAQFQRAEYLLRTGRTSDGEELFENAFYNLSTLISKSDDFKTIFTPKIENLTKLFMFDIAIRYLERTIELFPEISNYYDLLTCSLLNMNLCYPQNIPDYTSNFHKALTSQTIALQLNPNNEKLINNMGCAHLLMGNIPEAEKYFRSVLELNPQNTPAIDNIEKAQWMNQNNGTYTDYLLRPVEMNKLQNALDYDDPDELYRSCKKYNNDRIESYRIHQLQNHSLLPHQIFNRLHPFKNFFDAVEDIIGYEIFLIEDTRIITNELPYFFYQFIVRYDDIDPHAIDDLTDSIRHIYDYFRIKKLISDSSYQKLINRLIPIKTEYSNKVEEYYKIRYHNALTAEEKENLIEELFGF